MKTHPAFAAPEYIRIDQQASLTKWIYHQTRPVVPAELDSEGQPVLCAYRWDYVHWLAARRRGEMVEPLD